VCHRYLVTTVYDEAYGYEIAFSYRDVPDEVDSLLRLSGIKPAAVLEICAGPADHAIECARRGMRATALDLSEAMCKRSAENATKAGVALDVMHADMLDFQLPYQVDLAFCMISSISHVLSLDDMLSHLAAVKAALTPGGVYVIEGSHPTEYLGGKATQSEWDTERDGIKVHLIWGTDDNVIDPVTQITEIDVTIEMTLPDGTVSSVTSKEDDRFWTATEMVAAARLAGLTVVGQYGDFDGRDLSADGAWRMITVLQS
jgi:SAM-dependent methyltransferase